LNIGRDSRDNTYVTMYDSTIEEISEHEVVQRIRVKIELDKIVVMVNVNEQLRDLDRRAKIEAVLELVLVSKNGNVVLTGAKFSAPLYSVNTWLNTSFTETEVVVTAN